MLPEGKTQLVLQAATDFVLGVLAKGDMNKKQLTEACKEKGYGRGRIDTLIKSLEEQGKITIQKVGRDSVLSLQNNDDDATPLPIRCHLFLALPEICSMLDVELVELRPRAASRSRKLRCASCEVMRGGGFATPDQIRSTSRIADTRRSSISPEV